MQSQALKRFSPSPRGQSRARRERAQSRKPVLHIALPGYEVGRVVPKPRETITALLRRTGWAAHDPKLGWYFRNGLPTILEINGAPVLRKQWRKTRIAANDNVRFVSRPLGGRGSKQVLGLVALVALTAFSGGIASALLGSELAGTALLGSLTAGQALSGALVLGGSLLINALTAPKIGATNAPDATIDQIYTATAQGNLARLGEPLPVPYGREKVFPDFAATPWSDFVGNDQYQNILLCIGMGKFSYEQMFVDDTPFWNPTDGVLPAFSSATVEFYEPGEEVTLFPINVSAAAEVSGQTLPDPAVSEWVGPYAANPSGTKTTRIAIDFVFPAGCFTVDDSGNLGTAQVTLTAQYRPINDAGAPIGDYLTLTETVQKYNSRSPVRNSVEREVAEGRYEVRLKRGGAPLSGTHGSNDVVWAGLRAFLKGENRFPDVSTIAIRIKGSESTQGSFRFGVLRTRILPVWDAEAADGAGAFVEQPTRNPGWAFYDMAVNTQYGAGISLSRADFNAIAAFATGCATRGDNFDYTFSTAVPPADAFDTALGVARAKHFWLGDVLSVVRDEWRDIPSMLLTDREIVRGSTQISWTMLGENDPDAVISQYIDEDTWRPAQVQYPPDGDGFTASNPQTIRINGILNRAHQFREAAFYYRQALYRRENVQLGSEYEGRALTLGAALRVQSDLPLAYGQAGAITVRTGNNLELSPPPSWSDAGPYFMRVRRPNGKYFGPFSVAAGDSDGVAVIDADDLATVQASQGLTLDAALTREDGGEYPSFELGTADNQSKVCVLLNGTPNGSQCTLNLVVDDPRVHDEDIGAPPVLPTPQFPENSRAPIVAFLQAAFRQGIAEPILDATWWPAPGARYYKADVSYDVGLSWIQIYEGADNKFSVVVDRANLRLRVQATAERSGAFSFVDIEAPTIVLAPGTVAPSSLQAGLKDYVGNALPALIKQVSFAAQKIASLAAEQDAGNELTNRTVRTLLRDQNVTISETAQIALGIDGKLTGAVFNTIDNNGFVTGTFHYNDGTTAPFTIVATDFYVAAPGVSGGEPVPVFTIGTSGGEANIIFHGNMIGDGSIKINHIDTTSLSTLFIQSPNGRLVVDMNNARIVGYRPSP